MDEDRLKGIGKQVSGSIKEAVGKVTGYRETQAEGTTKKMAGEVARRTRFVEPERNRPNHGGR